MGQNAPKLVKACARESFALVRTFFCSLTWPHESLFWRSSCSCCKMHQSGHSWFLWQSFHISQHHCFSHPSLTTVTLQSIVYQYMDDIGATKTRSWSTFGQICCIFCPSSAYFPSSDRFCWNFHQSVTSYCNIVYWHPRHFCTLNLNIGNDDTRV